MEAEIPSLVRDLHHLRRLRERPHELVIVPTVMSMFDEDESESDMDEEPTVED
jgi:hypothetical protein